MLNKAELLLPAGSLVKLKTAVLYGADAVYAGTPDMSLRAQSIFSMEDLQEGIDFAHAHGKKIYLTLNLFMHNRDVEKLPKFVETLRQLNPQYKLDIIPATTKPYTQVLPQRYVMQYIAHEPEIHAKDSMYLKEYINPANIDKKRQERSGSVYEDKKGDTLGAIARRYRVTTTQIMRWNNLKRAHKLRIGQRLRIEGR